MKRLAALLSLALLLAPGAARADDYGAHRDIRAIRHDLPIIVGDATTVSDVVVQGNRAIARASGNIYGLERIYGRWWDVGDDYRRFPNAIVDLAKEHIGGFPPTPKRTPAAEASCDHTPGQPRLFPDGCVDRITRVFDHYDLSMAIAKSDAPADASFTLTGRRPSENESWEYHALGWEGNSYFFFSMTLSSTATIRVAQGSTIDVHCPFVLDPTFRYSLTIANAQPIIGPIDATLSKNTLHFVLPAFAAAPGADLMGEIDGDPPS